MRRLASVALIVGCLLLAYSLVRPEGDGGRSAWTPEKALAKRQAAVELHQSMGALRTNPIPENRDAFREKHEQFDQLEQERLAAIEGARRFATYVRWAGIGSVALGVLLYALPSKKP